MTNKPIKTIGMTADDMIAVALAEYAAINGELTLEAFEQYLHDSKELQTARIIAREEAMIRTVALMIERNNQALLQHLKQFGVVRD